MWRFVPLSLRALSCSTGAARSTAAVRCAFTQHAQPHTIARALALRRDHTRWFASRPVLSRPVQSSPERAQDSEAEDLDDVDDLEGEDLEENDAASEGEKAEVEYEQVNLVEHLLPEQKNLTRDDLPNSAVRGGIEDIGHMRAMYEILRDAGYSHEAAKREAIDLTPVELVPTSRAYEYKRKMRVKALRDEDEMLRQFEAKLDKYELEADKKWKAENKDLIAMIESGKSVDDDPDIQDPSPSGVPSRADADEMQALALQSKSPALIMLNQMESKWREFKWKYTPDYYVGIDDWRMNPGKVPKIMDGTVPDPLFPMMEDVLHRAQLENLRRYLKTQWQKEQREEAERPRDLVRLQLDPKTPNYEQRNSVLQLMHHDLSNNPYLSHEQKETALRYAKNLLETNTLSGKQVFPDKSPRLMYAEHLKKKRESKAKAAAPADKKGDDKGKAKPKK